MNNKLTKVVDRYLRETVFSYDTVGKLSVVSFSAGQSVTYTYDANNNLIKALYADATSRQYVYENTTFSNALTGRIDENTNRIANYRYDDTGRADLTEKPGGINKYVLVYNTDGTTTVTDPSGAVRTYTFITEFGVTKVANITGGPCTSCGSNTAAATYDENGYLDSKTDLNENLTTYDYNAQGLQTSRTEAVGKAEERTIITDWNTVARLPTKITEPGKSTDFNYDANSNLTSRIETDTNTNEKRTVSYTYNDFGQVLTVDGPRTDVNDVTTYSYDAQGNLTQVQNALGHTSNITSYDSTGRPLSLVDANGLITTLIYDGRGRLKSRNRGGEPTTFDYDSVGNLQVITTADGRTLTYGYDAVQRLTSIQDQLGNTITYTLDAAGNRTKEDTTDTTNVLTQTRQQLYNDLNQLTEIIGLNNHTTTFAYDGNGNRTTTTDAATQTTTSAFDALNRLISVLDPDPSSGAVKYGYDPQDNLVSVEDVNGNVTTYGYDGFGNRTSQTSPDTGTTTFSFDETGNVLSKTDAKGQITSYEYDALNRLTFTTYSDGSEDNYFYDEYAGQIGRLNYLESYSDTNGWSGIMYEYDIHGRLEYKEQMADNFLLSTYNIYDTKGRLSSVWYSPSGTVIEYIYSNGQLSGMMVNNELILSNISYQPFGPVKGWIWGNGSIHSQGYDLDGRLISQTIGNETRTLGYDSRGNIETISSNSINQLFGYDFLNRLETANDASFNQTFDYDANGNRTSIADSIAATTDSYGYDASNTNRLVSIAGSTSKTYQYDLNGNITNDGIHSYGYDVRNRLINVDTTNAKYQHNTLGSRIVKETPDKTTSYYYNEQGQLIAEGDQYGEIEKEIFYLGSQPVAVRTVKYDPATAQNVGTLSYIHTDHLGTPRVITDPTNNTPVWTWHSDPFGQTAANDDPDGDGNTFTFNLRFPGQYYDVETGSHYNYFRDYDPSTGRYVQSDPIDLAGGLNTYGYVGGNPLRYSDKFGLHYYPDVNGSITPHTHPYPNDGSVDFGPKQNGMVDPTSPEHYQLPGCLYCSQKLSKCLYDENVGKSSASCLKCYTTKGKGFKGAKACLECAKGSAAGFKCMYDNCESGLQGQDQQCNRKCELKGNCCDKK